MKGRQLSFLPRSEKQHGGDYRKGKRKVRRPFHPKLPLHITLRSSRARGAWSLLKHRWKVTEILQKTSDRHAIRAYRFANVGNHLHLLIQARSRAQLQAFLREFSGTLAAHITGAIKGRPQKFWDGLAWSKMVEWGRQFQNTARYVLLNVMESAGLRNRELLVQLERDRILFVRPKRADPGS